MISGFPTSVFVDVLQGVMYVYFIGLLFWFPRIIAFSYRWRVLEKMTALVADSPGPVLVNDNDDADSPAISNSNYGGGRIFVRGFFFLIYFIVPSKINILLSDVLQGHR